MTSFKLPNQTNRICINAFNTRIDNEDLANWCARILKYRSKWMRRRKLSTWSLFVDIYFERTNINSASAQILLDFDHLGGIIWKSTWFDGEKWRKKIGSSCLFRSFYSFISNIYRNGNENELRYVFWVVNTCTYLPKHLKLSS